MFVKKSSFRVLTYEELSNDDSIVSAKSQIKVAFKQSAITQNGDASESSDFDLEAEIKSHPESLYIKCFAIKADEMNDNGDYFSRDELIKATHTFVGVPVFTNHENTDILKAKGKVVHSWWDENRNGIMIIARVDAEAYPDLANGIKKEYILSTSMGAQVRASCCSVCHNFSETPDSYCSCIRERKTRHVSSKKQKCQYFKNGKDEQCPLCQSTKNDIKTFAYEGKAFEHNYGVKFIENSFVCNPACADCGVTEIIDSAAFLSKLSTITQKLPKLAQMANKNANTKDKIDIINSIIPNAVVNNSVNVQTVNETLELYKEKISQTIDILNNSPGFCDDNTCVKIAGQKEIGELNQALDLITAVSQSMLQQKDQLDLEFLSDLVSVLSDLQAVTDELTEQGYGRLQSPTGESTPVNSENPQNTTEQSPQPQTQPVNPIPGGTSNVQSGTAGSTGTVTMPTASQKKINMEKLAKKAFENIKIKNNDANKILIPFKLRNKIKGFFVK